MTTIDLSKIPPPDVIEQLDFEVIYQELLAEFKRLFPAWTAALESDPVTKLLELAAYREILLRARVNDAAHACMLAYASGSALEHLAALISVTRLVGDGVEESDERLRLRAQMALEGETVAGSRGSYVFHALSASPKVKDVAVDSPALGVVRVVVLSTENNGQPDSTLLNAVGTYLSADQRRPLTDRVDVEPAQIVPYTVAAKLNVYPGPGPAQVLAAAQAAVAAYTAEHARLGHDITLSGLYACLHQPGVQRVVLTSPAADIVIDSRQASVCTAITLELGVTDV
ncbi:baseplate assembly protein [Rivihabitans pingtungensis]|uniref:baseplate assembly protein n=1 Tax=Rivihabitans pingtungensis TaxID=1054498 RepID=UPI0023562D72|nr:baseplate J/gp47 family protein [Rivihabitans pingtungensis]MCK6435969.1 baseplate J/gp47 family protein [Rivihabitans pingtungensis]